MRMLLGVNLRDVGYIRWDHKTENWKRDDDLFKQPTLTFYFNRLMQRRDIFTKLCKHSSANFIANYYDLD